ncbi:Galactose-binding domain-like protein [Pseudohyphozyma bogoriensis]|nr:Galactose-binding domain-like protein [Pseudohyphozyma bogoriensis]
MSIWTWAMFAANVQEEIKSLPWVADSSDSISGGFEKLLPGDWSSMFPDGQKAINTSVPGSPLDACPSGSGPYHNNAMQQNSTKGCALGIIDSEKWEDATLENIVIFSAFGRKSPPLT